VREKKINKLRSKDKDNQWKTKEYEGITEGKYTNIGKDRRKRR
jgi:hypothetical protein